jgi:hypothetical protein
MVQDRTFVVTDIDVSGSGDAILHTEPVGNELWYVDKIEVFFENIDNLDNSEEDLEIGVGVQDPDSDQSPLRSFTNYGRASFDFISGDATGLNSYDEGSIDKYVSKTDLIITRPLRDTSPGFEGQIDIIVHARKVA